MREFAETAIFLYKTDRKILYLGVFLLLSQAAPVRNLYQFYACGGE